MVQYGARSILQDPLVRALRLSKKKKKKTKCGKTRGRSLHVGATSLGCKVSYVHCSVPLPHGKLCLSVFGPVQD